MTFVSYETRKQLSEGLSEIVSGPDDHAPVLIVIGSTYDAGILFMELTSGNKAVTLASPSRREFYWGRTRIQIFAVSLESQCNIFAGLAFGHILIRDDVDEEVVHRLQQSVYRPEYFQEKD